MQSTFRCVDGVTWSVGGIRRGYRDVIGGLVDGDAVLGDVDGERRVPLVDPLQQPGTGEGELVNGGTVPWLGVKGNGGAEVERVIRYELPLVLAKPSQPSADWWGRGRIDTRTNNSWGGVPVEKEGARVLPCVPLLTVAECGCGLGFGSCIRC